jgi:hypothetical protein
MGADQKHQNEKLRRSAGWDLATAGAIPRIFVGENVQRDGRVFGGADRINVESTQKSATSLVLLQRVEARP